MNKLPLWRYPGTAPAFHDVESATALEAGAKVYGAMNKLIEEYNSLATELNKEIENFTGGTAQEIQNFKETVDRRLCEKFNDLNARMGEIKAELLAFNNAWLGQYTNAALPGATAADNGKLLGVVDGTWAKVGLVYNPVTESLEFG